MSMQFDATYYLTHRPDVFQAFVSLAGSTGLSWAEFAQQHYNNHGRYEGANPNAIFNTDEYLAANTDVAAAGVNPFEHYLTHGVNEGRAPNASFPTLDNGFDADAYLAANSDLGEAGIDTAEEAYAHFVIHGQFENRPGAPEIDHSVPGETFTLTTDSGEIVNGTVGNDTFNVVLGGPNSTLNIFDQIDGGAGVDTLNLVVRGSPSVPTNSSISGVEIVNVDQTTATMATLDSSAFKGVQQIWQIGQATDITVGEGVVAGFRNTAADTVTVADGVASASVALDNATTGSVVAFDEETNDDLTTVSVSGKVADAGAVTIDTATDTTAVDTINLGLTSNSAVTVAADAGVLTTLNAADSTGNLTLNLGATYVALEALTGGSGNDIITFSTVAGTTADAITVDLGAGNDVFNLNAGNTTAETKIDITLGAGNDTLAVAGLTNITANTAIEEDLVTVLDFNAAQDVLDLSALTNRDILVNTELGNIAAAATLAAAAEIAAQATTIGQYSVFDYKGDAYILNNAGGQDFGAGDGLIKVVGFSVGDITAENFVA